MVVYRRKRTYACRNDTMTRIFAETKALRVLLYACMLANPNMYEQSFRTAAIQDTKRMEKAFRSFFFPFARVFRGCFFLESALCWQSQKRDKPSWSFFASLCPPVSHRQVAFGGCISFPKRLEGS